MPNNKRTYSKPNPEKEIRKLDIKKVNVENFQQKLFSIEVAPSYQKPSKEIIPKSFFIIISGGEVRERDYFKIISNQDKFQRIKIEFIADPNKLTPKGMLSIAEYKQEIYLSSQEKDAETPDKIYIVSDVDSYLNELIEIKPTCLKSNLHLIISNCCFEVWLYYAYRSDIPKFQIPEKIETISWNFKKWIPKAINGGINPTKAIFNIKQNIENSRLNYKESVNGIPELFSTNMHELADNLLLMINSELDIMIKENELRENEFRKKKS